MKPSFFSRELFERRQIFNLVLIVNEMVDEKRILGEEKEVFKIKKANDHLD